MYDAFKYFTRAAQLVALESEAGDAPNAATARSGHRSSGHAGGEHTHRRGSVLSRILHGARR